MTKEKLKNGKHTDYYEDDVLHLECYYKDGKLDGKWTQWYKDGSLAVEGKYKNDVPAGQWKHHVHEDKNLHSNRKDGSLRYWKFVVNAGVRYGEVLDPENSGIATLEFNSKFVEKQPNRKIFEGQVTINDKTFGNTRCVFEGKQLITYHPIVKSPEAHKNKLGGLVDYLMYSDKTIEKTRLASFYHKCYRENPLITAGELIERDMSDIALKIIKDERKEISTKARDELYDEIRNDILVNLAKSNTPDTSEISTEIRDKISVVEKERKLQKSEVDTVEKSGEKRVNVVTESKTLIAVDPVLYNGHSERKGNLCTRLTFEDGSHKYMKNSTWDNSGDVERKAISLIGKMVRTTCWDRVGTTKFSDMNYFKNIYQV